jgi:CheY-like chemotaxis protein
MTASRVEPTPQRTALVVDDELVVRTVLRRFFGRHGWQVLEAENGEGALEILAGETLPDVVICDLNLPGLSGTAFCRRAIELRPQLASRLVLTSGDPLSAAAALDREHLDCPVLAKPFTLSDLDRILDTLSCAA